MQTFLPYEDFEASARCLDRARLGKQRVEAMMIGKIITDHPDAAKWRGWISHPAVTMWRGSATWLLLYGSIVCDEWRKRGYVDNLGRWFDVELCKRCFVQDDPYPVWLGNEWFHYSHQSNLVRKNLEFYGNQFAAVHPGMPYLWPKSNISAEFTNSFRISQIADQFRLNFKDPISSSGPHLM